MHRVQLELLVLLELQVLLVRWVQLELLGLQVLLERRVLQARRLQARQE